MMAAALAAVLGWAGSATAGPMLSGSVSYDPGTHLYTYSYTLDDRTAADPVTHIYIRVLTDAFNPGLTPTNATTVPPYQFGTFTGQGLIGHPELPGGTFFGWTVGGDPPPVTAGLKDGFSFTTPYAPMTGGPPDFYLWSTGATDAPGGLANGVQEVGWVVAPDFAIAPTPEPGSLALAVLGLMGVGAGWARRRLRSGA
jgi:hypothetical protein